MVQSKREEARRKLALVVLGMHRSGTSAMAGCLARLGAGRPRAEIAPTVNNPKGYYESEPIMAFNDRLLELSGSAWHDWRGPDVGRLAATTRDALAREASTLLADAFGEAHVIVFKDPRLCRLMPFWRDVLDRAGYEARYVLPVRQPLQSALSLRTRNGFSLESGRLLWLGHVFEAERHTRGFRRHILASESLVAAPHAALSAILDELAVFPETAGWDAVGDFIEPALFHRDVPSELPSENRWIAGLCDRVHGVFTTKEGLAGEGLAGEGLEGRLDSLYAEFEAVTRPSADFFPVPASPLPIDGVA